MEHNNDLKEKYVVTSKPSDGKTAIGSALFALAIIFMGVAAIVCFVVLKESQAVAIAMLFVSLLLGLCLIGISTIIKNQDANNHKKYYIEEHVNAANANNSVSRPSVSADNVSKEVVRAELMNLISAVIKEELKNVKYTAEVKAEAPAPKAEPVRAEAPAPKAEPVRAEAPAPKAEPVKAEAPAPKAEPVRVEAPAPKAEPVKTEAPKKAEEKSVVLSKSETPAPAQATPVAPVTPMAPTTPVTPVAPVTPNKPEEKTKSNVSSNEWKCNNCGRVNRIYIGMCACGVHISENNSIGNKEVAKSDDSDSNKGNYSAGNLARGVDKRVLGTVSDSVKWSCKLCGRLNENTVSTCGCGNSKAENDALTKATASTEVLQRTGVNVIKSDSPFLKQEERPKNVNDPNSIDYDVAAARAEEEKKLAEEAAKAAKAPKKFTQISADEWKCNVCNRINRNYIGTCACGNSKM